MCWVERAQHLVTWGIFKSRQTLEPEFCAGQRKTGRKASLGASPHLERLRTAPNHSPALEQISQHLEKSVSKVAAPSLSCRWGQGSLLMSLAEQKAWHVHRLYRLGQAAQDESCIPGFSPRARLGLETQNRTACARARALTLHPSSLLALSLRLQQAGWRVVIKNSYCVMINDYPTVFVPGIFAIKKIKPLAPPEIKCSSIRFHISNLFYLLL